MTDTSNAGGGYQPQPYMQAPDEIVTCPECDKGNDSDARFCDQCGFALTSTGFRPADYSDDADDTVTCPSCQNDNAADASYCDQCGFELAGSNATGGADQQAAAVDSNIRAAGASRAATGSATPPQ